MKTLRTLFTIAGLAIAGQAVAAPVPVLNFPGAGYIQYGDFRSYSMPILDWASGGQYMFNTANTIQDALVIGTGSQTNNQDLGLAGTVANGFDFPNIVQNGVSQDWSMGNVTTHPGDTRTYWSVSLAALRDYLTFGGIQHDMVAYFNNNQNDKNGTAPDGTLANNLWAWAKIDLVGAATQSFYLRDTTSASRTAFGHADYVLSGGPVTLCYSTATPSPATEIPCSSNPALILSTKTFQHNLGQNDVSYAIFSDLLNSLIWSNAFTEMRVSVDFLDLNNGFENLFIGAACVGPNGCQPVQVPEPAPLTLLGLAALLGAAVMRRRSK